MSIQTLSIDLETRSGADISKTGVYRYAEDPDFDILLFGVSIDGGPVTVYDLASGEQLPIMILGALCDDEVMKCIGYTNQGKNPQSLLEADCKIQSMLELISLIRR